MKIVVIGTGIPGLGAATRCEQAAHPTTLLHRDA